MRRKIMFILLIVFSCFVGVGMVFADEIGTEIICPLSGIRGVINFEVNGGNSIASISLIAPTDNKLPIPQKEGYTFAGWYYDATFNNLVDTDYIEDVELGSGSVDANGCYMAPGVTLYADWNVDEPVIDGGSFGVRFITNGGEEIIPRTVCIACGDTTSIPVPKKDGYTFVGWYYNEELTDKVNAQYLGGLTYSPYTKSVVIYSKWEKTVGDDIENPNTGSFAKLIMVLGLVSLVVASVIINNIKNKFIKI